MHDQELRCELLVLVGFPLLHAQELKISFAKTLKHVTSKCRARTRDVPVFGTHWILMGTY